ncbi:baseplate J/gp47 family protein [Longirhabdus pacifica]|uniref:baseplate J/gp47 family protein n=1 Tax=Longirhabdus pacifica TaxID=2305227 RepID=UPI0010092671|nr:baseplate J/gp47 family protein [Longirhabdus pacifica]
MAFEGKTKDQILQSMIDESSSEINTEQGSVTYDLLSPAALELAQSYVQMERALELGFAETTYGQYLTWRCNEMGVFRKKATAAKGLVTFIVQQENSIKDGVIPEYTQVATENGLYYTVKYESNNGRQGKLVPVYDNKNNIKYYETELLVIADEDSYGSQGNVEPGEIVRVVDDLSGVSKIENTAALTGGVDEESDEELLERYLETVRNPATSGNKHHYKKWAREVEGVADAQVYPLVGLDVNGEIDYDKVKEGNVTVVVVENDMFSYDPENDICNHVQNVDVEQMEQDMKENKIPIGAKLHVAHAKHKLIDIDIDELIIEDDSIKTKEDYEAEIRELIDVYLSNLPFTVPTFVRYSHIANFIGDMSDVHDYLELVVKMVNCPKTNSNRQSFDNQSEDHHEGHQHSLSARSFGVVECTHGNITVDKGHVVTMGKVNINKITKRQDEGKSGEGQ